MLEPTEDPVQRGLVEVPAQFRPVFWRSSDAQVCQPGSVDGSQFPVHEDEMWVGFHRSLEWCSPGAWLELDKGRTTQPEERQTDRTATVRC
jgi:hypothetical protein